MRNEKTNEDNSVKNMDVLDSEWRIDLSVGQWELFILNSVIFAPHILPWVALIFSLRHLQVRKMPRWIPWRSSGVVRVPEILNLHWLDVCFLQKADFVHRRSMSLWEKVHSWSANMPSDLTTTRKKFHSSSMPLRIRDVQWYTFVSIIHVQL